MVKLHQEPPHLTYTCVDRIIIDNNTLLLTLVVTKLIIVKNNYTNKRHHHKSNYRGIVIINDYVLYK